MNKTLQFFAWSSLLALLVCLPCLAGDVAVLRNGFSIRHERRQVIGTTTRLYIDGDNSNFVDVPTADIDHFEALPDEPVSRAAGARASSSQVQAPQQKTDEIPDFNALVDAASEAYKLDPDLVNSVIRAESGFNVRAVSPKGAQGLMQLMPQTASQLGVQNAFDARANVEGGARYLRELLERYDFDLIKALAAYNAGPERVERYGGVPPYYETKAYVARIVRDFNKKKQAQKNAAQTATKKTPASANAAAKTRSKQSAAPSKSQSSAPQVAAVTASR